MQDIFADSLSVSLSQELKKFEVNTLVRVCDATYDKAPVEKEGIEVMVRITHTLLESSQNLY